MIVERQIKVDKPGKLIFVVGFVGSGKTTALAAIGTAAWVINQSLASPAVCDPRLVPRKKAEREHIEAVVRKHPGRLYL